MQALLQRCGGIRERADLRLAHPRGLRDQVAEGLTRDPFEATWREAPEVLCKRAGEKGVCRSTQGADRRSEWYSGLARNQRRLRAAFVDAVKAARAQRIEDAVKQAKSTRCDLL